jgi:predicted dehydrogenase
MHSTASPKILICGLGSIGERHANNLLDAGFEDLVLLRRERRPTRTLKREIPTVLSFDEAKLEKPDVAFICSPSHLHGEHAMRCASMGCHLFIEKPVAHDLRQINALRKAVKRANVQVMVGYMMRFHPLLIQLHDMIKAGDLGEILTARSQWGEYLPDWHPWEDYRQSYAAVASMGGGPTLTLSHELDTLAWLLGPPRTVKALVGQSPSLETTSEAWSQILLGFGGRATASIQLDYLQKPPARSLEVVGTCARAVFDYYAAELTILGQEKSAIYKVDKGWNRNDMFRDEVQYFMDALDSGSKISPSLEDGELALSIALSALKDAQNMGREIGV